MELDIRRGGGRKNVVVNKIKMPKRVTIYRKTKGGNMKKIKTVPCCKDDLCPPTKRYVNKDKQ